MALAPDMKDALEEIDAILSSSCHSDVAFDALNVARKVLKTIKEEI